MSLSKSHPSIHLFTIHGFNSAGGGRGVVEGGKFTIFTFQGFFWGVGGEGWGIGVKYCIIFQLGLYFEYDVLVLLSMPNANG